MNKEQKERMKYVGVLNLLCECSVYVDEDLRERIEMALDDGCADGRLEYRRILNRFDLSVAIPKEQPTGDL